MKGLSNAEILDYFFKSSKIDINHGKIFGIEPEPMPKNFDFDRVEGMMLGLAIGDALGVTTEDMLPRRRKGKYGEIGGFLPNPYVKGRRVGTPSDDTQLAFWTLEQLLEDGRFIPDHIARKFCSDHIFGIGKTVKRFISNYKDKRKTWFESGVKSAGNGALMRISPILVPHLESPSKELWIDTALSAMITHNDSASISVCIALVNILWQVLRMNATPKPEWWLKTYTETVKDLEIDESYKPRGGSYKNYYRGTIWQFVEEKVNDAYHQAVSVVDACNSWRSGAYLLETVPSVIYILMRYGNNLEEAIVRAVNDTKDNDIIGAIVGAVVGALHGKENIPDRWLSGLTGRTRKNDDEKIFVLLKKARQVFWSSRN